MPRSSGTFQPQTIAILGGTGRFGVPYIQTFLDHGLNVRILTRSPVKVTKSFPTADVLRGNMMSVPDVKRVLDGVAAVFLITPMGGNDDVQIELRAARSAIAAARAVQLPHLIYLSLIQPPQPTGVPMLEVKRHIELMIMASGLPFSSLRTGCYMDIWLTFLPMFMKLGIYLMPVAPHRKFSFTSQQDVARVAVSLIRRDRVLNGTVDIIEPQARAVNDVVKIHRATSGRRLIPVGSWLLPVLTLLRPVVFRWAYPKAASRVRLFNYFNKNDWVGDAHQMAEVLPGFHVASMWDYLRAASFRSETRDRLSWKSYT